MLTKRKTQWEVTGRLRRERGVALLTALAVLAIIYLLGTAYVTYMTLETEETRLTARSAAIRATAERGVFVALGDAGQAIASGHAPSSLEFADWPVFEMNDGARVPEPMEGYRAHVTVSVTDESGRINVNAAPVRLLERALGLDPAQARSLRQGLPRPGEQPAASRRWLGHVDELITRGYVTPDAFAELPPDLLTVYPIPSAAAGANVVNVNTAPPAVLAAVLDIGMGDARRLAAQRPWTSIEAVAEAAGKDPSAFAVAPAGGEPAEGLAALSLDSRCYRFRSTARIEKADPNGGWRALGEHIVEVVAVFDEHGHADIQSWRAVVPATAEYEPAPAGDGSDTADDDAESDANGSAALALPMTEDAET